MKVANVIRNPSVVIVASAFGTVAVRRDGHGAWIQPAADAGAAGFEIRRELFADEALISAAELRHLRASIETAGLWSVYSSPAMLFDETGALDEPSIVRTLAESASLGARMVKFQLGGDAEGVVDNDPATLARLIELAGSSEARVVVENGQLQAGGTIDAFARLFEALSGSLQALAMTFDTGNWLWARQDPMEAARRLGQYVAYVHCKSVENKGVGARRFATAPAPDDTHFSALLRLLPRDVPRGIEFPFDPDHLAADAARYVTQIALA